MQAVQALEEDYLKYWDFENHPFLLSPQPSMFYEGGQYFECLERLRYAVKTQKGGALIVSEEAGLGKTTIILKLIEEMKGVYGEIFKFALIEHPTLNSEQMIAYIKREITGREPEGDKLRNLIDIRAHLIELFEKGGKCIIAIDEAHMLKDQPIVLQELRMLINLTYRENYLHTFIISGQKPLWGLLSDMREFWQRLPVKYYLLPLTLEETKNLINFRIRRAGCKRDNIYTDEAIRLIHRASSGCPRTILALADFSLLVGHSNLVQRIGEKEVMKALEIIGGKGEAHSSIIIDAKERKENFQFVDEKKKKSFFSRGFLFALLFLVIPFSLFAIYMYNKNREFQFHLPQDAFFKPTISLVEPKKEPKEAQVSSRAANVRAEPRISSQRIAVIMQGERVEVIDERVDEKGEKWLMIELFGKRRGWISEKVVDLHGDKDANTR